MKELKEFTISFIGLKEGNHQFEYQISKEFFDFFSYEEVNNSNVKVELDFLKKTTMFELSFKFSGTVEVYCDVTNEPYNENINQTSKLVVKFGEAYDDVDDELLIIPHAEYKINVAQYIYETIVLAIPIKKVHPDVANGTMKSEVLEKLKEYELKVKKTKKQKENTDPRWDKLKDIIIEKNKE